MADALGRIDGTGRRLLALRSYLRSRTHLADRWSWTSEQIAAYEGTAEHGELLQEIERVRAAFVRENPGFELWVNPQVRSLDIQLEHWNTNESVAAAAANLLAAANEFVASPAFPAAQPARATKALESFLASHVPAPTPTIAAPGTVSSWPDARDRLPGTPGRAASSRAPRLRRWIAEWDEAGWPRSSCSRSRRRPAVRRATRVATRALALHVLARDCCGAIERGRRSRAGAIAARLFTAARAGVKS